MWSLIFNYVAEWVNYTPWVHFFSIFFSSHSRATTRAAVDTFAVALHRCPNAYSRACNVPPKNEVRLLSILHLQIDDCLMPPLEKMHVCTCACSLAEKVLPMHGNDSIHHLSTSNAVVSDYYFAAFHLIQQWQCLNVSCQFIYLVVYFRLLIMCTIDMPLCMGNMISFSIFALEFVVCRHDAVDLYDDSMSGI